MSTGEPTTRTTAIVTASYGPDLERCRLLCETVDRYVSGHRHHYILVAGHDLAAFRPLQGPRRTVVDERDLLPSWLHSFPDPFGRARKRIWLSLHTAPLRGWHVQQLRRIAIAGHVSEDALVYCDSDVAFLRTFDCASLWRDDDLRLFRRENGLEHAGLEEQRVWSGNAGRTLGLPVTATSRHDYIATVIAWRRDAALGMCRHVAAIQRKDWVAAIASNRNFSECMLYGRYADEVLSGEGHFHDDRELCRIYWTGPALTERTFPEFVAGMQPHQVAIGVQSFTGTDVASIRRLLAA